MNKELYTTHKQPRWHYPLSVNRQIKWPSNRAQERNSVAKSTTTKYAKQCFRICQTGQKYAKFCRNKKNTIVSVIFGSSLRKKDCIGDLWQ